MLLFTGDGALRQTTWISLKRSFLGLLIAAPGTDQMEQVYWQALGGKPPAGAYVSAGLGMGEVLNMAAELQAYTLSDRATYLAYRSRTGLAIALESDARMFNPYGIIAVNPVKQGHQLSGRVAVDRLDHIGSGAAENCRVQGGTADRYFFHRQERTDAGFP